MPYVRRDDNGKVVTVCIAKQEGRVEELLDDLHPDLVSFRTPKAIKAGDEVEDGIKQNSSLDALIQWLAATNGIAEKDLIVQLRNLERKRL